MGGDGMDGRLNADQRRMAQHGLAVLLLGLFAGFGLAWSAIGRLDLWPLPIQVDDAMPGSLSVWRGIHSGALMNGLMAIGFALAWRWFDLSAKWSMRLSWAVVGAIWANAAFYVFRLWAPNMGLTIGDNRLGEGNWAGVLSFLPAYLAAFATIAVVIVLMLNIRKAE